MQQLHRAVVILLHGAELGGVAVPDVAPELQPSGHAREHVAAEAVFILRGTLVHEREQQLLAENVDLQRAVAARRGRRAPDLPDRAVALKREVGRVVHEAAVRRADGGDVRAALQMRGKHVRERQIDDKVAVGEHDVVLPYPL